MNFQEILVQMFSYKFLKFQEPAWSWVRNRVILWLPPNWVFCNCHLIEFSNWVLLSAPSWVICNLLLPLSPVIYNLLLPSSWASHKMLLLHNQVICNLLLSLNPLIYNLLLPPSWLILVIYSLLLPPNQVFSYFDLVE